MEPESLQSWVECSKDSKSGVLLKKEFVLDNLLFLAAKKVGESDDCIKLFSESRYADHIRGFKCPCGRTWFGCYPCRWKSSFVGIRARKGCPGTNVLIAHFISPGHVARVSECSVDESPSVVYRDTSFDDNGTSFPFCQSPHSNPTAPLLPPSVPTIMEVYDDVDQSDFGVQTVIDSIRNETLKEFVKEENKERLRGCRSMVTRAFSTSRGKFSDAASLATPEGSHLMMVYARLLANMSVKDRIDYVWMTNRLFSMDLKEEGELLGPIHVPRNIKDAEKYCMTGNQSILKAMPVPNIVLVPESGEDQHVVVDPFDCLTWLFAILPLGLIGKKTMPIIHVRMDDPATTPINKVSSYFESKSFMELMSKSIHDMKERGECKAALLLSFKLWSDGWDPDGTKNNRNGVWSLVWTLMIGDGPEFVFPLAIGSKSIDHQPALRRILGRINDMGEYINLYHLAAKKVVRVRLNLALYNVDRLERGELWGGLNHAANRGKCHGVVYGFAGGKGCKGRHLNSACSDCVKSLVGLMMDQRTPIDSGTPMELPQCSKCACYDPVPTNLCTSGPIPKELLEANFSKYDDEIPVWPNGSICCGDPSAPPTQRPVMGEATTFGALRVSQDFNIKAAQFITYQVWSGAVKQIKIVKAWGQVCGWSEKTWRKLFEVARHHKVLGTMDFSAVFVADILPTTWVDSSLSLDKFLDAPMHLLFLGIVQTLVDMLENWLAMKGLKSSFLKFVSAACEDLGKLNLQFLRLLKYGTSVLSRGSWVSEQYVAFSRVLVILHAGLILAINGEKGRSELEVHTVLRAVDSCFCCISLLMQRTMTESLIARAAISIKVYLAAADELSFLLERLSRERAQKIKGNKRKNQEDDREDGEIQVPQQTGLTSPILLEESGLVEVDSDVDVEVEDDVPSFIARLPHEVKVSVKSLKAFLTSFTSAAGGSRAAGTSKLNKAGLLGKAEEVWTGLTSQQKQEYLSRAESTYNDAPVVSAGETVGGPPLVDETPPLTDASADFIPTSLAIPNHASLPNITLSMQSHGPPVDQWEGADGGEKAIQSIKPFMHGVCVVDGGLLLAALKRYYRNRLMSDVTKMLEATSTFTDPEPNTHVRTRCTHNRRYRSREEVKELLVTKEILSGRLYEDGNGQVVLVELRSGVDNIPVYLRLTLSPPVSLGERDILFFTEVTMTEELEFGPTDSSGSCFISYVVLIPGKYVWRDNKYTGDSVLNIDGLYTLVTDDYKVLKVDGTIGIKYLSPSLWRKYNR